MEYEEYSNVMNCSFCAGVDYACNELLDFMKEKKRTIGQIEKFVQDQREQAIKTRKTIITSKKVIRKVSVLH